MAPRRVSLGRGTTALVHAEPHGTFWDVVASGSYEPAVGTVIASRVEPGGTFVDIGAWIGCYTLLAARLGAHVVAYEPDSVALVELQANLALNADLQGAVTVRPVAVARRSGLAWLAGGEHGLGSSLSRLVRPRESEANAATSVVAVDGREVGADPLVRGSSLVKIDIEGAEFAVVPRLVGGLGPARPPLLVSVHGFALRRWAERRGRFVRLPIARLVGARRRAQLLWSLRHYRVSVLDGVNGDAPPIPLRGRFGFCLRLAEVEVYAEPR